MAYLGEHRMLDTDDTFDTLADGDRRELLVDLLDRESHDVPTLSNASLELLTAHDALVRRYLTGSLEVADTDKDRVRMHHVHLPKLVSHGFIEWERDAQTVTKGPRFDEVRPLLELVADHRETGPATKVVAHLRD